MKVQVTGCVIARTKRKGTDGVERYAIVLEAPPAPFRLLRTVPSPSPAHEL